MEEYITVAAPGAGAAMPSLRHVPQHVAIIMDGNGRWANERGLPRTRGHERGEIALLDTVAGAVEAGVRYLTVYAFSTENWKRSPSEVRFLMGYSRDVLRRRRDQLHEWGVRVDWWGRRARLWSSVIRELDAAKELTRHNTGLTLTLAVNYGARAELTDAVRAIAQRTASGDLNADRISERTITRELYGHGNTPDVDLLIRTGGEQRLSNFLLWQCAYAELAFSPTPWPEYGREALWADLAAFGSRERRFGSAVDRVAGAVGTDAE